MKNEEELSQLLKKFPINVMPGFFTVMNTNLEYLIVNEKTIGLIGYRSEDQLVGTTYFDMPCRASESAELFIKEDRKVLISSQPIKLLSYQCFNNNDWKIMVGEKSPIINKEHKVLGVSAHFIDVSDLRLIDIGRFLTKHDSKLTSNKNHQFTYSLEENYQILKLSDRQSECLFFLLRGKTCKAIAEILNLSVRTVEGYINEIKMKLGCYNKTDLIDKAIAEGYLNIIPRKILVKLQRMT